MKKNLLTVLLFTCAILQTSYAQLKSATLLNTQPALYNKTEWEIKLNAEWQNPYLQEDVSLDLQLKSPSGKKLLLPCYYVSGESGKESVWKARFAPQEAGKYRYTFRLNKSNKPSGKALAGQFNVSKSAAKGFLKVKNNWILQFDNGEPYRAVAENICWESRANDDSKFFKALHEQAKYNYEEMLPAFKAKGGDFYRTWISHFNLPIDWKSGFNSKRYRPSDEYFNPSAVSKLDRMITLSDSLGLYIMLTLGPGAYSERDGGFSPNAADFFVNPKSKQRYKDRLRYIIARWGYSPSIAAWEFFNEVDNVQFSNRNKPISADSIVQWHDEMSTYLKQIDPYQHIVTTSISHRDLKGLNSLKNIDINQKHIYKNTKGIPSEILKYEEEFKKPYVVGEFSYEWDWSKNFDDYSAEMDSDFKRGLWYGLFSPTPVLPMSWWWEYFENRGTDKYYKNVKTIRDEMLAVGKGEFETIKLVHTDSLVKVMSVKCGKKVFTYVFNSGKGEAQIDLELPFKTGFNSTKVYRCETGIYEAIQLQASANKNLRIKKERLPAGEDFIFVTRL